MGKRILSKEEWIRRKKTKNLSMTVAVLILLIVIVLYAIFFIGKILRGSPENNPTEDVSETLSNGVIVKLDYLKPNPYSRPQTELKQVNGIVIHYTANPGTTAEQNRSYFQGLATKHTTSASSHFIIGLEGEVLQCIPLTEIAYASNDRNADTISIECCHPDETGKFNDKTYASLISLVAKLCEDYNLEIDDVIRHYDVTEKLCPLYYVEHEDAWLQMKKDISAEIDKIESESEK